MKNSIVQYLSNTKSFFFWQQQDIYQCIYHNACMHALDIYVTHKIWVSLNLLAVTVNSKCINASGICLTGSRDFVT